jgi:divalent metal cation (Fe/Co/Zn/Cd) transporter
MKVAKERKSAVLASNAVHHRVDSLTGIVTLFAILGANLLHNAAWLDPLGGLVISLLVIKAGWGNTVSALYELVDKSIDDEIKTSVRKHALRSIEGLSNSSDIELREVEGIKSGQNYLVDLLIAVPRSWTLAETQTVEDGVRSAVGSKVRGVRRVKVRFVALDDSKSSLFDEFIPGDVSPQPSPEPEEHDHDHDHDHEHDHDHGHKRANGSGKKTQ